MLILNQEWMYIHIPRTSGDKFRTCAINSIIDCENYSTVPKITSEMRDCFWKGKNEVSTIANYYLLGSNTTVDYDQTRHAFLSAWQECNVWNNHKVFTIVRNPYSILVSGYKNICSMLGQNMTLDEFLIGDHPMLKDIFTNFPFNQKTKQIDYLRDIDGNIKVDRFYKMETDTSQLADDFGLVGINDNYQKEEVDYSEIYTDSSIEYVKETFKDDFEYFGYDTNPFWV